MRGNVRDKKNTTDLFWYCFSLTCEKLPMFKVKLTDNVSSPPWNKEFAWSTCHTIYNWCTSIATFPFTVFTPKLSSNFSKVPQLIFIPTLASNEIAFEEVAALLHTRTNSCIIQAYCFYLLYPYFSFKSFSTLVFPPESEVGSFSSKPL